MGGWARVREGVYVVGGAAPARFKR
jgi:hypothetical protein